MRIKVWLSVMIDLWKYDGFGKYNNGIIEMINSKYYKPIYWTW
ncbi:hypothetical protein [Aureibaculum marinum]|nr:hypothetical protein [Aureibaculum marinum]